MISATIYYIPYGNQTLVLMGAILSPHELCLRIGLGSTASPEQVEQRDMTDLWMFRNYQMELYERVTWLSVMTEFPTPIDMDSRRVRFGEAERIRSTTSLQGIPHSLFVWFDHEGDARRSMSILIEKSRDALKCATIRDEINIFNSVERFFTPHVKDWDEDIRRLR
jgi:hypothetical protein